MLANRHHHISEQHALLGDTAMFGSGGALLKREPEELLRVIGILINS